MVNIAPLRSGVRFFIHVLPIAAMPLCVASATVAEPSVDPVDQMIAAERSFAVDVQRMGIASAFRAYASPDGILMRPDPAPALEVLQKTIDTPGVRLEWQPVIAAMARSGDLGFTTGPYRLLHGDIVMNGDTLTVWERGPDGRWGWFLDHGLLPNRASAPADLPTEVTILRQGQPGRRRRPSDVIDADAALNAAIVTGGAVVIPDRLADDGFLLRQQRGRLSKAEALGAGSDDWRASAGQTFGIRASHADDLAATYGRLTSDNPKSTRNYVRIWRREATGWQLLIDLIN